MMTTMADEGHAFKFIRTTAAYNSRYIADCICGYSTGACQTQNVAIRALNTHLRKSAKAEKPEQPVDKGRQPPKRPGRW